jgi:hypothetical protein
MTEGLNATSRPFRQCMSGCAAVALALAVLAVPSAQALPEEQQGARIVSEIQAGKLSAQRLSSNQYEHVGEYVMGREIGSPATHERMNATMETMMGQEATDQIHVYLGKRYLGLPTQGAASGLGMMMMNPRGLTLGGAMSRGMMGYDVPAHHAGLRAAAVAGIVAGSLAVVGTIVALLLRRNAH